MLHYCKLLLPFDHLMGGGERDEGCMENQRYHIKKNPFQNSINFAILLIFKKLL